jgi:uncharacterized SAM-binding protein YcdF (DUF218 family)
VDVDPITHAPVPDRRPLRGLRLVGLAGLLLFVVAAFTPLANRLNIWMAGQATLEPADAIVVLGRGGADTDGVLTNRSLRRTLHGIALYGDGLAPVLVFSGSTEETHARASLAQGLWVPSGAILRLASTNTTKGEAEQLRRRLLPLGRLRILLVADPIDMLRARAVMERAGFTVLPAPTAASGPSNPESRLGLLRDIVSELAGWIYYRLAGAL